MSNPGLFTFRTTSTSGQMVTHTAIEQQVLTLVNVRVQFAADTDALAAKVIYIDLPCFNSNSLVDALDSIYLLPIPLENAVVTNYQPNIPITMSSILNESFNYRIVNDQYSTSITNLVEVCLQFSYNRAQTF